MIEVSKDSVTISGKGSRPIVMFGIWPHEIKILNTPEELAAWERRAEAILGYKVDAKAVIQGGGCCCGGGGGMCDSD